MRWFMMTLAAWLACASVSFGEPIDKEKLRKLIELPYTREVCFDFPFFPDMEALEPPTKEAIDKTLREMKGDASDAPRYEHLGDLYYMKREQSQSDAAYAKAIQIYRDQIKNRPKDGALRARFAKLLLNLDRDEEAESELRQALQLEPRSAECLMMQGTLLADKCGHLLFGRKNTHLSSEEKVKRMRASPPSSQQVAEIRRLIVQSRRLMDQAVALEPENIDIREKRVQWLVCFAYFGNCLRLLDGEKIDLEEEQMKYMFSPSWAQDLYEVYRRKELRTSHEVGTLITLEMLRGKIELPGGSKNKKKVFDQLSDEAQKTILRELNKVEGWMKGTDKKMAAEAAEVQGLSQFIFFENQRAAEVSLRHAISLDPSRQKAREMLLFLLEEDNRINDAVKILEAAIQVEDTPRNRFLLARLLQSRDRKAAARQLILGLRLDHWDVMCNLGLAALFMKRGDKDSLDLAETHLIRTKAVLDREGSADEFAEYFLLHGIYEGLCNHRDSAQELLKKAAQQGATDRANRVLAVLSRKSSGKH